MNKLKMTNGIAIIKRIIVMFVNDIGLWSPPVDLKESLSSILLLLAVVDLIKYEKPGSKSMLSEKNETFKSPYLV